MSKALLIAGGIINLLFGLFHIVLGYQIQHLAGVAAGLKGLMMALNIAGTLSIFFFAYASLFARKDLVETRLGRAVLVLVAALYLSRAAEEFIVFPVVTPVALFSCLVVGALYLVVLAMAMRSGRAEKAAAAAA